MLRLSFVLVLFLTSVTILTTSNAQTKAVANRLEDVLRQGARVANRSADEIPIEQFQSFARRADDQYLGVKVRGVRQIDDATVALIRRSEAGLMRSIDDLPLAERLRALRVSDGAILLRNSGGNRFAIERIVRSTGPDGMLLISKHGDDAVDALKVIDSSVQAGRLEPNAMTQFAQNMNAVHPNALNQVWQKAIKPNWGKFLAAGTVAAFIAAPEQFLDGVGNLTAYGAEKFGEFVPELVVGAAAATTTGLLQGFLNVATGRYALGFWALFITILGWISYKFYPLLIRLRATFRK